VRFARACARPAWSWISDCLCALKSTSKPQRPRRLLTSRRAALSHDRQRGIGRLWGRFPFEIPETLGSATAARTWAHDSSWCIHHKASTSALPPLDRRLQTSRVTGRGLRWIFRQTAFLRRPAVPAAPRTSMCSQTGDRHRPRDGLHRSHQSCSNAAFPLEIMVRFPARTRPFYTRQFEDLVGSSRPPPLASLRHQGTLGWAHSDRGRSTDGSSPVFFSCSCYSAELTPRWPQLIDGALRTPLGSMCSMAIECSRS